MKMIYIFFMISVSLFAQSFYVLTGVKAYKPIVVNQALKAGAYTTEINEMMVEVSKDLGIAMKGNPYSVLALVITPVGLGGVKGG